VPNAKHPISQSEFITRAQAATDLCVSIQLIDKLIRNGQLPYVRVGRLVRIRRSAIEVMLREGTSCN